MTRISEITTAPNLAGQRSMRFDRQAAIAVAALVVVTALAFAAFGASPRTAVTPTQGHAAGELVDGWMPAVSAANRAAAIAHADATVDGWMPAVSAANRARSIAEASALKDGWSSLLLEEEPGPDGE